ncbi:MAG TPA: N-acetylmuramoyl-L-alanine amidase [Herpetosiphonaceae bacterium]
MPLQQFDVQDEFQGGFWEPRTETTHIVVHHAAALYPQQRGIEDVRSVADYHVKTRGWSGIGYHIALAEITQGGAIGRYNLSRLNTQRAHIAMLNHRMVGVSCLTNFDAHPGKLPIQKWLDALVETLRELVKLYPKARIVGHRDVALPGYETICPGSRWADWKPGLLKAVGSPAAALPAPAPSLPAGTYPVDPAFLAYWQASGGTWQPARFAPGYATTPARPGQDGNQYQVFERAAFRLVTAENRIESLLRDELLPALA